MLPRLRARRRGDTPPLSRTEMDFLKLGLTSRSDMSRLTARWARCQEGCSLQLSVSFCRGSGEQERGKEQEQEQEQE